MKTAKPKNHPDKEELIALHTAAQEFFKMQPWQWMDDTHFFGFQSPENHRFGFCCVLGNMGQVHGLCVYRGQAGLQMYLDTIDGKLTPPNPDLQTMQDCLLVTLNGAGSFEKQDREDAKTAGFPLQRGKKHPFFRSYRPGLVPWFLTSPEARFLTLGLQQAVEMAPRVKEDLDLLDKDPHKAILMRQPEGKAPCSWKEIWVKPHFPPEEENVGNPAFSGDLLEDLKPLKLEKRSWIVDFSYLPIPVANSSGPDRYPKLLLILDLKKESLVHYNIHESDTSVADVAQEVLHQMRKEKLRPQEIIVKRKELLTAFTPLKKDLGISISQVDLLPEVEAISSDLIQNMWKAMK